MSEFFQFCSLKKLLSAQFGIILALKSKDLSHDIVGPRILENGILKITLACLAENGDTLQVGHSSLVENGWSYLISVQYLQGKNWNNTLIQL